MRRLAGVLLAVLSVIGFFAVDPFGLIPRSVWPVTVSRLHEIRTELPPYWGVPVLAFGVLHKRDGDYWLLEEETGLEVRISLNRVLADCAQALDGAEVSVIGDVAIVEGLTNVVVIQRQSENPFPGDAPPQRCFDARRYQRYISGNKI